MNLGRNLLGIRGNLENNLKNIPIKFNHSITIKSKREREREKGK